MTAPNPLPKYIYKIVPGDSRPIGEGLPVSDLDKQDGFLHMSTAEQVPGTVSKFFADKTSIFLLKVSYAKVESKIKWDKNSHGTFPHIYDEDLAKSLSEMEVEEVIEVKRAEGEEWGKVVEGVLTKHA